MNLKKHAINFSKYFSVGAFVTIFNIFLSWLLIDVVGFKAFYSSTIVAIITFFMKYTSYLKVNLLKRAFAIFLLISILSAISYILLTTILIDFLFVPTLIAVPFVVIALFLLRFLAFYWAKIIKK